MTRNGTASSQVSVGFVDTFENGNFSGWCYNNQHTEKTVILKINAHTVATIQTTIIRDDVTQQLKVEPTECGFNFTLHLHQLPSDGCTISFHEPVNEKILHNGLFTYEQGQLRKGAVDTSPSSKLSINAYIDILSAVKSDFSATTFIKFAIDKLRFATPETFVALSYILILGRTPDPDGFLNSLKADLSDDNNRRDFLHTMVSSHEFKQKRTFTNAMRDLAKIN